MESVIVVASSNDSGGVGFYDLNTGTALCTNIKNSLCGPSGITNSAGDHMFISQLGKPVINVYQMGKQQVHMQCHVQEITQSITADPSGYFIYGGTKGGRNFCWELSTGNLKCSWQAHFKAVNALKISDCGNFCVSGSEDGMVRVWDLISILSNVSTGDIKYVSKTKNTIPFRSWNAHSLAVTSLEICSGRSVLRIISCSLDRNILIHDVFTNQACVSIPLPESLESLTLGKVFGIVFCGGTSGKIYMVNLSVPAIATTAAHAKLVHVGSIRHNHHNSNNSLSNNDSNTITISSPVTGILMGHEKAVTSVVMCSDDVTMVSGSKDGSLRIWNVISQQCIRQINPFNSNPLSAVKVMIKSELLNSLSNDQEGKVKYNHGLVGHLRKYPMGTANGSSSHGENNFSVSHTNNGRIDDKDGSTSSVGYAILGALGNIDRFHSVVQECSSKLWHHDPDSVIQTSGCKRTLEKMVDSAFDAQDFVRIPTDAMDLCPPFGKISRQDTLGGVEATEMGESAVDYAGVIALPTKITRQDTMGDVDHGADESTDDFLSFESTDVTRDSKTSEIGLKKKKLSLPEPEHSINNNTNKSNKREVVNCKDSVPGMQKKSPMGLSSSVNSSPSGTVRKSNATPPQRKSNKK